MFDIALLRYYMNADGRRETQTSLCHAVGVSEQTMSSYFTGKRQFDMLVALNVCEYLCIPVIDRGKIFLQENFQKRKLSNELDFL